MAARKINVIIWLIKAAEIDVVRNSSLRNLIGLHFDLIYTPPYAMCLNTVSEIIETLEIEDDQNIIATSRFSTTGMLPPEKAAELQKMAVEFVKDTPVNVDVWQEIASDYTEMAIKKAKAGLSATFAELAKKPCTSFTLLIINNDRLPLLELLAIPLNKGLKIPAPGDLVQLRFTGTSDGKRIRAKLVYAAHEPITGH